MTRTTPTATAAAAALILCLSSVALAPPATAMQNIKCIKNEVGALASRWAQQAGEARAGLSGDGSRGSKRPPLDALVRDGRQLATACATCGARREAERVRALTDRLQQARATFNGKAGDEASRALDDTLAQIEGLRAEFGL